MGQGELTGRSQQRGANTCEGVSDKFHLVGAADGIRLRSPLSFFWRGGVI